MSFSGSKGVKTFGYPLSPTAKFTMTTDLFPKFKEEWRDMDYYYYCEKGSNGMICSVLFYRLNADEQKTMIEPFGDKAGAGIPYVYFSDNSQLKKYEKNNSTSCPVLFLSFRVCPIYNRGYLCALYPNWHLYKRIRGDGGCGAISR